VQASIQATIWQAATASCEILQCPQCRRNAVREIWCRAVELPLQTPVEVVWCTKRTEADWDV